MKIMCEEGEERAGVGKGSDQRGEGCLEESEKKDVEDEEEWEATRRPELPTPDGAESVQNGPMKTEQPVGKENRIGAVK